MRPEDADFADYVEGRRIALVGPAPLPHDQSAEIDAHDIVYRIAPQFPTTAWHGSRTDVGLTNSGESRRVARGQYPELASLNWLVTKAGIDRAPCPHRKAIRHAHGNPNQVTLALMDLAQFAPADVTVYGADFWLGGPGKAYIGAYAKRGGYSFMAVRTNSERIHDQVKQRHIIAEVRARKGWPNGDDRFIAALELPDDEFRALWKARWYAEDARKAYDRIMA